MPKVAKGIVTLTPRAEKGWPVDASSRNNVAPASKRLGSEGLQRPAGYQMALDVELVVDGGMNREELLRQYARYSGT